MCEVCGLAPCHPRCPNAPEQKPVYRCCECDGGIYEGDKYFQYGNLEICESCMDEKSAEGVLRLFDEKMMTA